MNAPEAPRDQGAAEAPGLPGLSVIGERVLFCALALLPCALILAFPCFASEDSPSHAGAAAILTRYRDPATPVFREYFLLRPFPFPNLTGHLLLILLIKLFPAALADKILAATIVAAFPFSMRYALRAVRPESTPLAYLGLPLALNWFFFMGFYNFSIGFSFFFLTLGFWLRRRDSMRPRDVLALGVLLFLTYLSHLVPYALVLLSLGARILWDALAAGRGPGDAGPPDRIVFLKALWKKSWVVALAAAPSFLLAAVFWLKWSRGPSGGMPLFARLKNLLSLRPVMMTDLDAEKYLGEFVALALILLTARALALCSRRPWREPGNGFLLASFLSTVLYFVVRDYELLTWRLILFPYFTLLLWMATFPLGRTLRGVVAAAGGVSSLALILLHFSVAADMNAELREYLSAGPLLRPNSTILPLVLSDGRNGVPGTSSPRPMLHASGYFMADRGVIDLSHYESNLAWFNTGFRPEIDPLKFIGGPGWPPMPPPKIDILSYPQKCRGRIDYVLVWGLKSASPQLRSDPGVVSVQAQLAEGYTLVFTSEPRGMMQLYERRK